MPRSKSLMSIPGGLVLVGLGFFLATLPTHPGQASRPSMPPRADTSQRTNAVTVKTITSSSELIGGPAAQGRVGDVLLKNDLIRVIIRAPGRTTSAAMFGGHLIDADIVRASGQPGRDEFGQLSTFINLSNSAHPDPADPNAITLLTGLPEGKVGVRMCGPSDLFDFLDLKAGLALIPPLTYLVDYDFDQVMPIDICSTFTLGPSDRSVKIESTLTNRSTGTIELPVGDLIDGGSDVEFWNQNEDGEVSNDRGGRYTWGGFGETIYTHLELMGFFGESVSYGYYVPTVGGESNALSTTVAGVTVSVFGTTRLPAVLRGASSELVKLRPGGEYTYTRYFIVGERDLGDVTDEMYRLQAATNLGTLTGTVKEETSGKPLAGVRVTVLGESDAAKPVTQFYTDTNGNFSGTLPARSYGLIAAAGFDQMRHGRTALLTPTSVAVTAGATVRRDLIMPKVATARIQVIDGADSTGRSLLPARVSFYGTDTTPPTAQLMDITTDPFRFGLVREVFVGAGSTDIEIKPGTYDVVISRGLEYDQKSFNGKTFTAGTITSLNATLTQVVDSTGYVSADLHVHAMNSPDAPVGESDRVMSFLADGVDVLVSTDHDFITDYRPAIDALGADRWMTSLIGEELTTFSLGHINAYPLSFDPDSRTGGSLDWGDNAYLPIDPETGEQVDVGQDISQPSNRDNLTPPQLLEALELGYAGTQIRQINHPRGDLGGHFTQIGLDLSQLGTVNETQVDPTIFRMPEGEDLFDPSTFEALEVQNGTSVPRVCTALNDQFALLNLGYRKLATSVSDTHKKTADLSGRGRTWFAMWEDDPSLLHGESEFPEWFSSSMLTGNVSGGNGPFVTARLYRTTNPSLSVPMGGTLTARDGGVTLELHIQSPLWISFNAVTVFANALSEGNFEDTLFETPEEMDAVKTVRSGAGLDITTVDVPTYGGVSQRRDAVVKIPLTGLTRDTWISAVVWDGTASLTGGDNWPVFSFINPIFVDVDGDGEFTAPCDPESYVPAEGCAWVTPPRTAFEDRQASPIDHHTESFYSLYDMIRNEQR